MVPSRAADLSARRASNRDRLRRCRWFRAGRCARDGSRSTGRPTRSATEEMADTGSHRPSGMRGVSVWLASRGWPGRRSTDPWAAYLPWNTFQTIRVMSRRVITLYTPGGRRRRKKMSSPPIARHQPRASLLKSLANAAMRRRISTRPACAGAGGADTVAGRGLSAVGVCCTGAAVRGEKNSSSPSHVSVSSAAAPTRRWTLIGTSTSARVRRRRRDEPDVGVAACVRRLTDWPVREKISQPAAVKCVVSRTNRRARRLDRGARLAGIWPLKDRLGHRSPAVGVLPRYGRVDHEHAARHLPQFVAARGGSARHPAGRRRGRVDWKQSSGHPFRETTSGGGVVSLFHGAPQTLTISSGASSRGLGHHRDTWRVRRGIRTPFMIFSQVTRSSRRRCTHNRRRDAGLPHREGRTYATDTAPDRHGHPVLDTARHAVDVVE